MDSRRQRGFLRASSSSCRQASRLICLPIPLPLLLLPLLLWGWAAIFGLRLRSVVQLIILLDFVYFANEWLLARDQCAFVLIGGSALLGVGSVVGLGFLFYVRRLTATVSLDSDPIF